MSHCASTVRPSAAARPSAAPPLVTPLSGAFRAALCAMLAGLARR